MRKIEYGECVNCEYCDTDNEKSWCKNPKGGHYDVCSDFRFRDDEACAKFYQQWKKGVEM